MIRKIALLSVSSFLLVALPASAQQDIPELDGAPAPLRVKPPAQPKASSAPAPKPQQTAPDKQKAEAARLARQADAQKAEAARLARQADAQKAEAARLTQLAKDLKARELALAKRASALSAEDARLAQQRTEQAGAMAAEQADLARQREDITRQLAELDAQQRQSAERQPSHSAVIEPVPAVPRPRYAGLDLESARRSCAIAGDDEARARNFFAAAYDERPRLFEGARIELRGVMRLEDRRGYRVVDTVCEIDANGEAISFAFLR
jgi:hypothetical protein